MKFKAGDKVQLVSGHGECGNIAKQGIDIEFIIIDVASENSYHYTAYDRAGNKIVSCYTCLGDSDFEPYEQKTNLIKTFMSNIIEKFKILKMVEPQRSFLNAGIADINGNLTEDGKRLFNEFLISKFQSEFKTEVVDPILAVDEKVKS